jgi:hypothetical protein
VSIHMKYHPHRPRVQTQTHIYTTVHKAWGLVLISGHPEFCLSPALKGGIHGPTWGGSMIVNHYLGRGISKLHTPCMKWSSHPAS